MTYSPGIAELTAAAMAKLDHSVKTVAADDYEGREALLSDAAQLIATARMMLRDKAGKP